MAKKPAGTADDPWKLVTAPGKGEYGLAEVTHDARNNKMRAK